MRITRDLLHKLARDTAEKYVRRDRGLVCIYLTGSLLEEEPLLGGTTDIDLVMVHNSQPPYPREIIRLSDEVHLDIANFSTVDFHQPRNLRSDPWLGSFLCTNPIVLHDIQHWFEFTQAGAGAQFNQPENVLARARKLAGAARQAWVELFNAKPSDNPQQLFDYLLAVENAANAVAVLTGTPLAERRFLLHFPDRAEAAGRSSLASELIDLLVPSGFDPHILADWLPSWKESLTAASQVDQPPSRLLPPRLPYYERAAEALTAQAPYPALWLVLRTWTQAASTLPADAAINQGWRSAREHLSLDPQNFANRVAMLDKFLDEIEEMLDQYAARYGV